MIVESGEQSSLYLIQRGTVRKQIKLAAIVVFVSLPGEKEQTLYIVLTKAQEILEPFYFWKVIESRKINVKNILNRIISSTEYFRDRRLHFNTGQHRNYIPVRL